MSAMRMMNRNLMFSAMVLTLAIPAMAQQKSSSSPAKPANQKAVTVKSDTAATKKSPASPSKAAAAPVKAKSDSRMKYYHEGDKTGFAGIGLGGSAYGGDLDFPPLSVGFEYGWHTNWSLGGSFSYAQSSYEGYYDYSYSYYMAAFRASYHFKKYFDPFIKDLPIDPFFTLMFGYIGISVDYGGPGGNYSDGKMDVGSTAGMRYWFRPEWAAQVELGYTRSSLLNLGIARRF